MSLTSKILLAMVAGLAVGTLLNLANNSQMLGATANHWLDQFIVYGLFDVVGRIFVASLKLLVVPLVFVSLVCGASNLGSNARMGAMAAKTLALYMFTTAVAISIALFLGGILRPGDGFGLGEASTFVASERPSLKEVIVNIVPSNPIQAMAEGNMLQVIVFSLLMGVAISRCGVAGQRVSSWFEDFDKVIMKMVGILMELAPYGVFCLLAKLFADLGAEAILDLGLYFFTVVLALLLHAFGVYTLLLRTLARVNPITFFRHIRPVLAFGFSTASSNATLPVTLRIAEEKLGIDNRVAAFTVPLGATINMDGTAIMQGVATAFIAQAYQIDIGISGYLMVILTATLASVGTAGVPGVGLITLAMVLQQVGLPVEGIALIIGVDRLLDMIRTAVNLTGDSMVSLVVARSENAWDQKLFDSNETAEQPATEGAGR
ncbi:MAG: dicarboxylate/amino acid:cation symporter [Gammaproteobacteria bacterium]|nr:dicarboxylate/amino acid:cation symporter [Gammaproteobacteria bacterium]